MFPPQRRATMNNYQYRHDYMEPDWYEPSNGCQSCEKKEEKLEELEQRVDDAANRLAEVIEMLYSRENLDKVKLEKELDELCYLLQVNTIPGDLQICRSQEEVITPIPNWLNNW